VTVLWILQLNTSEPLLPLLYYTTTSVSFNGSERELLGKKHRSLPARRCASAVHSHGRVSVRLSVTSRYCNETVERSRSFWRRGYPWRILHCVIREFGYLRK